MEKNRVLIIKAGRLFFAIALFGLSMQQFMYSHFRPVVLPSWSPQLPGRLIAVYLASLLMIAAAAGLVWYKKTRQLAILLGVAILLLFAVGHLPYQLAENLHNMGPWTNTLKTLTFSGGAFIIAGALPRETNRPGKGIDAMVQPFERLIPAGPVFLSAFMIFCGIEHFVYTDFVASLIPSWIPWHVFWTYFAAIALTGAGIAIILRVRTRLVATLLGTMLFLWLILLHIPRAIADPYSGDGNEWSSVFEALAFSGFAFVLALRR